MATPQAVAFLLHCAISDKPYPIGGEAGHLARFWQDEGMVMPRYTDAGAFAHAFQLTEKGQMWVDAVIDTPLPVSTFIIPRRS